MATARLCCLVAPNKPSFQSADNAGNGFVHMLNCTLTATQRTLCCLLENHQTEEGFKVPDVLQPYMHGQDFVKFRKPLRQAGRLLVSALRK
ncbi:AA_TRNA_LIGASE_II domain-containing protein [Haematococcus lacustris]|uniref:AA_TRNA_LIGASE_II domain-containing protein n=1 Tax=Haematococcus lacustris TaxID=44745 RepID=A0A699ZHU2_HAELA|nr:AA_TRNA_LIGASE_II domain-containing protein [Haematococcus lacustris]